MEQPSDYVAQEEAKVYRLKKAIYELKQSPRAWFKKFSITISDIDFHQCQSVFVRGTKSGIVVLTVYVDILLTGSDSARLLETKKYLKHYFVTKNMGCLKYFLRIKVHIKNTVYFFLSKSML